MPADAASINAKERLLALLREALADQTLVRLTLGAHIGQDRTLKNLLVRPLLLRNEPRLSFVYRHATCDVTKNFAPDEALSRLEPLLGTEFRTAHLSTTRHSVQLEFKRGRDPRLTISRPVQTTAPSLVHDRPRQYRLPAARAPWLADLGVTTADGKVARGMEPKMRQIQKFVELLQHLLAEAGPWIVPPPGPGGKPLTVPSLSLPATLSSGSVPVEPAAAAPRNITLVDMGCGKGYLTFAAYDCLRLIVGPQAQAQALGIEARTELVASCNQIAAKHGLTGLGFHAGDIADAPLERMDVLLALHACDTATDDALARGIRAGAALILVSPCCHKELRPQLRAPAFLQGALRHGILLEREAEFVTDALRASLLEWAGYDTRVFEFIATEHTSKNLMIAGIKRRHHGPAADSERQVRELAGAYGIRSQQLATQLGFDLQPSSLSPHGCQ